MLKLRCTILLLIAAFAVAAQTDAAQKINWPAAYEPGSSKFYVHNEIEITAPPERVWYFLTDALQWELWYKGAKKVSLVPSTDTVLNAASVFRWQTMGLKFESAIKQFIPNRVLAWESKKKSIRGYHVWLIVPTDKGCKVITDESQNGWLTFLEKTFQRKKLKKLHQIWLEELKRKAESEK